MGSKKLKVEDAAEEKSAELQPSTILELGGKTYQLVFTFRAIRTVKTRLRAQGIRLNLLRTINFEQIDADTLPELLSAALQTYHPELTFDDVMALITLREVMKIIAAVAQAYMESVSDPDAEVKSAEGDPQPEPGS